MDIYINDGYLWRLTQIRIFIVEDISREHLPTEVISRISLYRK